MNEQEEWYVVTNNKFSINSNSEKINKAIYICNSYEQAKIVESNIKKGKDISYVNITKNKPKYDLRSYSVQEFTVSDYPNLYSWKALIFHTVIAYNVIIVVLSFEWLSKLKTTMIVVINLRWY